MQIKIKYFGGLKVKKVKQTKIWSPIKMSKIIIKYFRGLKIKKKVKYCRIWAPKCPMQVDRIRPFQTLDKKSEFCTFLGNEKKN